MYEYSICTVPDRDVFLKQCAALERHIPDLLKGEKIDDVDGSETQLYTLGGKKVYVHNSFYVGAVYVESEIRLENYFN